MKRLLLSICIALMAGWAVAQQDTAPVEPMDQTPVFRVNVVSRTTKAVNYRHRGGSTTVDLKGTSLMPQAGGKAKVDSNRGGWKSMPGLPTSSRPPSSAAST